MVSQSFSDFGNEEEDPATQFVFDFCPKSDSELLLFDPITEWLVDPDRNNNLHLMSDNLLDHQKESILIDEKMEKISLVDSTCSLLPDKEELQLVQEEINTASPVNGGELKEADVTITEAAIMENTANGIQINEKEESEDSSSEEDDDSSSSSDSDSSTSSGDEEEEVEDVGESSSSSSDEEVDNEIEEGEIRDGDAEFIFASDGEEAVGPKAPIKSKHEIEDYPPVPPITASLEPHHQTLPVGVVSSIMGSKVIVEGSEKHTPLKEGSILWITETRLPLGIVDEIFGPVKNPYYIVRYNSESEVPQGVESGILVSFVADFADHILNDKSLYEKGYDASGADDEEVDLDLEFSDDEKEAEYRRSLRQSKRDKNHKEGSSSFGSNKKKNNGKPNGHFGKFNAPQPTLNNVGESAKVASSMTTFPTQHSNSTPNSGMPPQQFATGPPQGFPPRPPNMGMPGGGYPMAQNWMPGQQQNQNFGMMQYQQQQQQQQQQQILTNALIGLIGQAGLGQMPFGSTPVNPAFNQGGFGQVPFGPMNPNLNGNMQFGPMNTNPNGQVPFGSVNPNGQMVNQNGFGQVPLGPMNPNGQMVNQNGFGQVPLGPANPNGQMVNQNGFGQVPFGSVPNQGEMGGPGSMQFNSGMSFSSSGSSNNNNNNRGRGRAFGRGQGRSSVGSRGGRQHNG